MKSRKKLMTVVVLIVMACVICTSCGKSEFKKLDFEKGNNEVTVTAEANVKGELPVLYVNVSEGMSAKLSYELTREDRSTNLVYVPGGDKDIVLTKATSTAKSKSKMSDQIDMVFLKGGTSYFKLVGRKSCKLTLKLEDVDYGVINYLDTVPPGEDQTE